MDSAFKDFAQYKGDCPIPPMDEQTDLTVGQTLQLFYKYGVTSLPVINERSELIGTFDKSDAVGLGTLRSNLDDRLADHLPRLMHPAGPAIESRLKRLLFEKSRTVPVLTRAGRLSHWWHVGDEPLDAEFPMPYRQLLLASIEGFQRPAAVMFQESTAGEVCNSAFLRRFGVGREKFREWMDGISWQGGPAEPGLAFLRDSDDLSVLLIRTPLRLRDQHYGWLIEIKEEYELSADVLCTERAASGGGVRKKIGAQSIRRVVNSFEQFLLKRGMARSSGDVRRLIGLLGVSRQSLRYKMKKHRLLSKQK